MALQEQIDFLRNLKESADKGIWWRDPALYPEDYRKLYEQAVSANLELCINSLEELGRLAPTNPGRDC